VDKIGVYLCKGCDLSACLDLSALAKVASGEMKAASCKSAEALCSPEGRALIEQDLAGASIDGVVIAACSPRAKPEAFAFGEHVLVERVNLREQVAWCSKPQDEDTQMLAEDYLRMGIVKARKSLIPVPYKSESFSFKLMVVGGGVTGVTAALEASRAGYEVILIEQESTLGGLSKTLYRQLPMATPFRQLETPAVVALIEQLGQRPNVEVLCNTVITQVTGEPGNFGVTLSSNGQERTLTVGTFVMATGAKPYDAAKLTQYGYGASPDVITNHQFEQMAKEGALVRPSNGKPINSVLFIQCAGSRDAEHLPYCSTYCCGTTLKQARYVRELRPEANAFIIYKDMRTPGLAESFYREMQDDQRLFLTKGEVQAVRSENGALLVEVGKTLLNDDLAITVDLVVLAVGLVPNGADVLKLKYRQGEALPTLRYDFPDSHFICFPYETRRTGIYAAGAIRAPMTVAASIDDARGAALKAIQCLEMTSRGEAVHPRSGDKSYTELYLSRCTSCKRCTEECPFGAFDEDEKGTPKPNPARCRRCGICMGACPERIISFKNYSIDAIGSMIKELEVPEEDEEKPRILVLACENDAYPAIDMAGQHKLQLSAFVRIIPVRCLGSVNTVWIKDALSKGWDGILQLGCKPGDDYQCHFIRGSELMQTRGENLKEVLTKMSLESERIRTEFVEVSDWERIPAIINEFSEQIVAMGANPFKGM